MTKEQILAEAMALDATERESLAEQLLLSIDGNDQASIDAAWLDEARRRDAAFAAGKVTAAPVDEAVARVISRGRP